VTRIVRFALVAAFAFGGWGACTSGFHYFIAEQYEPKLGCVDPGSVLDILNGPDPGVDASCDARCIVPPFEGGVYVSVSCPPYPPGDDISGTNPLCAKALAALARVDICLDSGPSNPLEASAPAPPVVDATTPPVVDASPTVDAASDAGAG
jgi:hypothetical protein